MAQPAPAVCCHGACGQPRGRPGARRPCVPGPTRPNIDNPPPAATGPLDRALVATNESREQEHSLNQVEIYTDGACKGNPGPGGWGVVLRSGAIEKELFGGELGTTNNRMELLAVIEALSALKRPCAVTLFLDSEYVRKGITEWIHGWKARGWRTASKQPVKNVELWQRLDALVSTGGHRIEWRWVKGHSGDPGNERADGLANRGVDKALGRA